MAMLRFADIDKPCLGDVYDGMDTMVEKVKIAIQHENDPIQCETLCNKVETIIHYHWEKMTTPLHLLPYVSSPRYYSVEVLGMLDRVAPYADEEVANGCKKAFQRLFQDEAHKKVRTKFGLFASGRGFTRTVILDQYDMEAITWWYLYGQPFKYPQPLAIKEELYKDGAAKPWDVAPESANLDAIVEDLTRLTTNYDNGDDNITTHGASSTSGITLDSNDLELAKVGDNEDFFEIPRDSD